VSGIYEHELLCDIHEFNMYLGMGSDIYAVAKKVDRTAKPWRRLPVY